jgi:hypothetical protein
VCAPGIVPVPTIRVPGVRRKTEIGVGWGKDEIHRPEQEVDAGVGNNDMSAENEPNSLQVNAPGARLVAGI